MFTTIFKSLFLGAELNKKNQKNAASFLFKEVSYNFKVFTTKIKDINSSLFIKETTKPVGYEKLLETKKMNREINKRVFHLKEELLQLSETNLYLFAKECNFLYLRELGTHARWLIYTKRVSYMFGYNFYLRQKNAPKLFNITAVKTEGWAPKEKKQLKNSYWGLISIWNALKIWLFSAAVLFMSLYTLLVKRAGVLPQNLFFWIGLSMLLYWLLSGFVFFVKKYQYSRFTSVIQRFWRRSYILFWLIESGLLLVFFYLTVNSTQESFYMFDQGSLFKTHLFSWKLFLFKCILIVSLITYSYLLLISLKWSYFNKSILILLFITTMLIYFVWIEFYQIYWVSNFYANFSWFYDVDEQAWTLEFDNRRTRILNHYVMVLFLLKFWHIIFILGCWIFFLLRANELEVITYPLYSFNFQNFIILFLMTWLFMYPWFKHTIHWLMEIPYYWFYVDTHVSFYRVLINDVYYFYHNCAKNIFHVNLNISLQQDSFINWFLFDNTGEVSVYIKTTIKNEILKQLIK